jgi:CubicO group peptidase (beta-lactamase class C family)
MRQVGRSLLALVILAVSPAILRAQEPKKPADTVTSAKQALVGFDSFLEEAIKAWEVPGLAIAIVKNGEVIMTQGFGLRDVAHKLPVTPKTLFAIGSCTKAFTTFVMGTLVDEGKLDWDTPVRTYIPELQLHDRVATELLTPRDLVTHRSGLPRHDMVWYNAKLSRKEVVGRLPYLEPTATIRNKFQYNNIMYMTAGYLVDRLTGGTWKTRFEPASSNRWKCRARTFRSRNRSKPPTSPGRTTIGMIRLLRSRSGTSPMSARPGRSTRTSLSWRAGWWSTPRTDDWARDRS